MRKSLVALLMLVLVMSIAACSVYAATSFKVPAEYAWKEKGPEMVDTTKFKHEGPWRIGFSNASTSNSWGVLFTDQAKYEAEKWSKFATFFWTDAQDSSAKQIADCEDLLAKRVDLLVIRPCTADSINPILDKCSKLGIPVVIANRPISAHNYVTLVGTRMFDMGSNMAEWLVAELKGKGNIVSIEGTPGSGPQIERWDGSQSVLKKYPGIKVLARGTTTFSQNEAKTLMENYLQAYPKIDGVLSQAGMMSVGVVEAIKEAGKDPKDFVITGDDYNGWLKWIMRNKTGMGTTNPTWCGAASIIAALRILNGESVPKFWDMGTDVFTYENGLTAKLVLMDKPDAYYPNLLPRSK